MLVFQLKLRTTNKLKSILAKKHSNFSIEKKSIIFLKKLVFNSSKPIHQQSALKKRTSGVQVLLFNLKLSQNLLFGVPLMTVAISLLPINLH
jgi:hypothetical protein